MLLKRVAGFLAMAFGALGLVASLAGIYGVWLLGSRLERANENVFAAVDKVLASAEVRIRRVQQRMQEARITSDEIEQKVRDASLKKVTEGLAERLEIEARADKLAGYIQTADSWLEASTDVIQGSRRLLELGKALGASANPDSLDDLLQKLEDARSSLRPIEQSVEAIRKLAARKQSEAEETRFSRIAKLAGRVLLTIADVDGRLDTAVSRLSEARSNAERMQARTSSVILLTTIACCFILAWIGAGQVALCVCGWKLRSSRE
jgi:hypothetical protein